MSMFGKDKDEKEPQGAMSITPDQLQQLMSAIAQSMAPVGKSVV